MPEKRKELMRCEEELASLAVAENKLTAQLKGLRSQAEEGRSSLEAFRSRCCVCTWCHSQGATRTVPLTRCHSHAATHTLPLTRCHSHGPTHTVPLTQSLSSAQDQDTDIPLPTAMSKAHNHWPHPISLTYPLNPSPNHPHLVPPPLARFQRQGPPVLAAAEGLGRPTWCAWETGRPWHHQ